MNENACLFSIHSESFFNFSITLVLISVTLKQFLIFTVSTYLSLLGDFFMWRKDGFTLYKCQPDKMVKYTQTIRQQQPMNCLSVFDHFVGLTLKGLK